MLTVLIVVWAMLARLLALATGLAPAVANAVYDALYNNTAPGAGVLQVAVPWVKLHTADPGAAGTAAAATNATRKDVSALIGAAAGGAVTNTGPITWSTGEVIAAEDYTHFTIWDASTGGNFKQSGTITANAVQIGDQFTIPTGDMDFTLSVAA
jgi:hypothetical protein